jgi:hypothetical protein
MGEIGVYHDVTNEMTASLNLKWLKNKKIQNNTTPRDFKNGLGSLRAAFGL